METKPTDFAGYLATVPAEARPTLEALHEIVKSVTPDAVESISYGVQTFKYRGRPLAYIGGFKTHCALYGVNIAGHQEELAPYDTSKGTIRFALGKPLPEGLIKALVAERMTAIEATAPARGRKKPSAEPSA